MAQRRHEDNPQVPDSRVEVTVAVVAYRSGATLARDANDGSWQAARGASHLRSARAGFEDMGAAHNPT